MENIEIMSWKYKYLLEIVKYKAQNYPIVYLDEFWQDSRDTVKKIWADSSKEFNLSSSVIKRKRVVICHAGSLEGFVDNAFLLSGNDIWKCYEEYHQNMKGEVFEIWFGNKLIPRLPKDIKSLIVVDNAKCYCRLMEKIPSMKMRKIYD